MPRSWRACWRGRRQNQIGGSRVGIQESRLASNDFKKAAERVRERWALGESKPVNAILSRRCGGYITAFQGIPPHTRIYTHSESHIAGHSSGCRDWRVWREPSRRSGLRISEWLHAGSGSGLGDGRQPRSPLGSIRTGGHRVPISIERVRRALGRCYRSHARRTHAPYPPSPRTRRRCHSTPRATVAVRSAARS